jgi:hypothetical protein
MLAFKAPVRPIDPEKTIFAFKYAASPFSGQTMTGEWTVQFPPIAAGAARQAYPVA